MCLVMIGITGGFVPANPTEVQTLTSSIAGGAQSVLVETTIRPEGAKKLPDEPTSKGKLPTDNNSEVRLFGYIYFLIVHHCTIHPSRCIYVFAICHVTIFDSHLYPFL